jgi:ribosomal protein L40E
MANALPIFFVIAAGLCLSLVLLAIWQSLRGVMVRSPGSAVGSTPRDPKRERLLHEKQELLTAIRDVRMEHELGKVSDSDFERLEQNYRSRARDVLRELEEQIAPHRPAAKQLLDQALGLRSGASPAGPSGLLAVDAPISPKTEGSSLATGTCMRCKTRNDIDAVFCKKCGERLRAEGRT